ncbi:MAG: tetratricopeptide repeat protein [Burkholderiaceae bacterium]|nr:tetratricopeptide repeat protein [Burkholderiaceae bacterium]
MRSSATVTPEPATLPAENAVESTNSPSTLLGRMPIGHADHRGCPVSGADHSAVDAFERALAAFVSWRGGAQADLALALDAAPGFTMAHALKAYLQVCSRDPESIASARPVLTHAASLPSKPRERLHLAAIAAAIDGDFEAAKSRLGECVNEHPRDLLALHVVQVFDHFTGDVERMRQRPAQVLPAWSQDLPGYSSLLTMQAFGLVEAGEFERAEDMAGHALTLDATDPRTHHVMAHVFEMTGRPDAGLRWMMDRIVRPGIEEHFTIHCWWHLALFHLARGEVDDALGLYGRRVRPIRTTDVADLIDATSLLWRIDLCGGRAGTRWGELAAAWAPHIDDRFCSFNDLHAALAFVGAQDWSAALRLERSLISAQSLPTRHGLTTRQVGLPACRALIAFGQGDDTLATTLLASLPGVARRLGGSHAQRDVLYLTLMRAIERLRRPARRPLHGHEQAPRRPGSPVTEAA